MAWGPHQSPVSPRSRAWTCSVKCTHLQQLDVRLAVRSFGFSSRCASSASWLTWTAVCALEAPEPDVLYAIARSVLPGLFPRGVYLVLGRKLAFRAKAC